MMKQGLQLQLSWKLWTSWLVKLLNKIKLNAKSGMQFTLIMIMITLQLVTEVLDILSGVVIGICF